MNWNPILNWRLLSGSHDFPGPDGGTCINEAAIVAAGFKYSSVSSVADCPPCFSRVLSAYAIVLNDSLPDDLRQSLLMPFVTRLAGTADAPEVERQRFDHIILGLIRTVLPLSLRGWHPDLASECELVTNYDEAIAAANKIASASAIARDRALALALALALDSARASARVFDSDSRASARTIFFAFSRVRAFAFDRTLAFDRTSDFDLTVHAAEVVLLDGAMRIGRQAEAIETEVVVRRLAKVRKLEPALD